ncbi:MAG: DNA/RNA non-specific endonuclease [Bacteroidota bacterium]
MNVGTKVLEFIFQGFLFLAGPLGQKVFEVIQKAGKTIKKIYKDPIQFIKNLLAAAKKGVEQFVANILTHLQRIILNWLFGEMADEIQIPERFDLMGILDLAMQVLGLTYQNFRGRLADRIGEENVARLEGAFEFIKILVTQGIAAAWEKILEYGTNIINGIIDGVKNMVITKIVEIGAQKLAMMLAGPYGAIVEAVITTYRFIATLIERINQIADFVKSIVDSVAEIADGKIQAAADYVERMIVKGFTMFISFLAGVVGLGSIPRQVKGVIEAIRRPINQAMDAVIGWVVRAGQALMGQGGQQEGQNDDTDYSQATPEQKKAAAKNELEAFISRGGVTGAQILAKFPEIKAKYHLSDIRLDFGPEQGLLINYFASPAGDPTAIGDGGDGSSAPPAAPPPPSVTVTGDNHDSPKTPYQAIVDAYGAGNVNRSKFRSTRATYDRARHIKMELVGGGVRGNRGPNQGIANSMGYDEHMVRHGRNPMDFQGGHLIGHHVSGAHSDEARNLAPQASAFNYTTYNHLFEKVMRSTGQDPTRASHVEVSVNLSYASTNVSLSHADLVTNGILHSSTPANPASVNLPKRIPQLWNARLTSKDGKPLPDREIAETRRTAAAGNVVDNVAEFNNLQIDVTNRSERYKHFKVLINQGGNVNADGSISAGGGSVLEVTGQQQD